MDINCNTERHLQENMMNVTFDSNLIQKVLIPDENKDDGEYDFLKEINSAIITRKIFAFVSEMYFTQESLCKDERILAFANNADGGIQIHHEFTGSAVLIQMTIGPAPSAHLKLNPYTEKYLNLMREFGIKILKTYRLGDFVNDDLNPSDFYDCPSLSIGEIQQRYDACSRFIENELHAGKFLLDQFLSEYPGRNPYEKAKSIPDDSKKIFAKFVAEMADEQTIAAHYAYGIEFFCTRDEASSAGHNSILSNQNRHDLFEKYAIRIIKLPDLIQIINSAEI